MQNISAKMLFKYKYIFGLISFYDNSLCHQFYNSMYINATNIFSLKALNSLAPERRDCNLESVIFKLIWKIAILSSFCEISLRWMPPDLTDDKSTLGQVMAWCRQATSHYLNQCWQSSVMPYVVTKPQWVNSCIVGICVTITQGCCRQTQAFIWPNTL